MKNVLAIAALFAAVTVGASAQYSAGSTGSGSGQHMFGPATYTDNNSGASAAASIQAEVVQSASVHYQNTPISISSALPVGKGVLNSNQGTSESGTSPTFFLIENQTATFSGFTFQVRGSEMATTDVAWSVTGSNSNIDITGASATIKGAASAGTEILDGVAGNQWTGGMGDVSFNHIGFDLDYNDGYGNYNWGHSFHANQNALYDETAPINVVVDFTVNAVTEPADDGFENGAGDVSQQGTIFEVKVSISDYKLTGGVTSL